MTADPTRPLGVFDSGLGVAGDDRRAEARELAQRSVQPILIVSGQNQPRVTHAKGFGKRVFDDRVA